MNTLPLRRKFPNVNLLLKIPVCCNLNRKCCVQSWPARTKALLPLGTVTGCQWLHRQLCPGGPPTPQQLRSIQKNYYSNLAPKPKPSQASQDEAASTPPAPSSGSSDTPVSKRTMPRLMNFPEIMWPSFFNSIRNWILVQFVIRPHFDRDFYLNDFVAGAKKAIQVQPTSCPFVPAPSCDLMIFFVGR